MTDNQQFSMIAKTLQGLEDVLADELKELGAKNIEKQIRAVTFDGDKAMMYRANYFLRTAITILKPIATFDATDEDIFYKEIGRINWNDYMDESETLAITAVANGGIFTHSKYISLKAKDAIVDQFRRRKGTRPNVDVANPDLKINIHINNHKCTVLLDSSGESLFKRGYRIQTNKAPINEVLAAGLIKLSGWNYDCDFIDPMCGSGTLLIEAAMQAYNIPAGTYRNHFGFETWRDFDADLFQDIIDEAPEERKFDHSIIGSDISPVSIKIAEVNIKHASMNKRISVKMQNFFDSKPETKSGLIVTNPPYGERLEADDLQLFYQKIGDKLKIDYPGFNAWLIGSNIDLMKFIGLKPEQKITLHNGSLKCSYRKFSLYEGSKYGNEPNEAESSESE